MFAGVDILSTRFIDGKYALAEVVFVATRLTRRTLPHGEEGSESSTCRDHCVSVRQFLFVKMLLFL